MKIQIIPLETYDNLATIHDKLNWRQSNRVLLLLPAQRNCGLKKQLGERLGMTLLRRNAEQLGVQVALVCRESHINKIAALTGVPVFADVKIARKSRWRYFMENNHRKLLTLRKVLRKQRLKRVLLPLKVHNHEKKRMGTFFEMISYPLNHTRKDNWSAYLFPMLFLVLGLFLVLYIYPSAEVIVKPKRSLQEKIIWVNANAESKAVEISGQLPITKANITLSGTKSIASSGVKYFPFTKARGVVRLVNLSNQALTIPMGTVLTTIDEDSTQRVKFTTDGEVTLPAKLIEKEEEDLQRMVDVTAVLAGSFGNIAAEQLTAFDEPLGLDVLVTNPYSIHNGTEKSFSVPSEADKEKLYEQLLSEMEQKAQKEWYLLSFSSSDTPHLLSDKLQLLEVMEKQYSPEDDLPSSELNLKMDAVFQMDVIAAKHLRQLGSLVLARSLPSDYYETKQTDPIQIIHLTKPEDTHSIQHNYRWQIKFQRTIFKEIATQDISKAIKGLPLNQLELSKHFSLESEPVIKIHPSWWGYLPLAQFRIKVMFQ